MLTKNIFRTEIKEVILDYMVKGAIRPGERLSLPKIAKQLDVSVTPIREALTQLTETGIVTYKANRGFFVTELSEREAYEIYEVIALLESQAIQKSSFSSTELAELREINQTFRKTEHSKARLLLDRQFHQKLIENYPNSYAKKIIEDIRVRIFIYELAFMEHASTTASAQMHDAIINHIEKGQITDAIAMLKANWDISIQHIVSFFKKN